MSNEGATPTVTTTKKRELTSPEFPTDLKKNRITNSLSEENDSEVAEMDSDTETETDTETGASNKLSLPELHQIAAILRDSLNSDMKETVKDTIKEQLPDMANDIVSKVITGLNERIVKLETENDRLDKDIKSLKKENKSLKTTVAKLEKAVDAGEQYSRRNSLRMSGVEESNTENTDTIVLDVARAIGSEIDINEIDRSHRVGKPKAGKNRDIIIKFSTYRARQKLYARRTALKDSGCTGVYLNEDLTKPRMNLLYLARVKVRGRFLKGCWSSDGTILVKDNGDEIHRITAETDLDDFTTAREPDPPKD